MAARGMSLAARLSVVQNIPVKAVLNTQSLLWQSVDAIRPADQSYLDNPSASQDIRVMNWIVGWNMRGLTTFFDVVSFVTSAKAGIIYGPVGIGFLLLLVKTRGGGVPVGRGGRDVRLFHGVLERPDGIGVQRLAKTVPVKRRREGSLGIVRPGTRAQSLSAWLG